MRYDIIGDVHGKSSLLKRLLKKLGYYYTSGAWRNSESHAIFLGDLIDRGDEQLEAIQIVRDMQQAGSAQCILGNHEFNALSWATVHPATGLPLRKHSRSNYNQHVQFLNAVGENSALHKDILTWFITLPLWINNTIHCIHACWCEESISQLSSFLHPENPIVSDALLIAANEKGTPAFCAIETLCKGIEIPLPDEHPPFVDKDGKERRRIRVRWWDETADTYRKAAMLPEDQTAMICDLSLGTAYKQIRSTVPLFVGHYWMPPHLVPEPLSTRVACLDYSAGKGGPLTAYRWDGEKQLNSENFVQVQP